MCLLWEEPCISRAGKPRIFISSFPVLLTVRGTPYHVPLRVDFLDKDGQLLCQKITDFQVSPDITTKVAAGVYADDAQETGCH